MRKKPILTQEDRDAFQNAMKDVTPLNQKQIRVSALSPVKKALKRCREQEIDPFNLSDGGEFDAVLGEEFIAHKQSGISNKTLRKLRKGQYNVEAKLDLHGMTIEEARTAVSQFLRYCMQERMRVVLIIHGKGHHSETPILKNKLNHWLREIKIILAFCSATPIHGSRGATYVLLKRTTEETFT